MNELQLDQKIQQDVTRVKKDWNVLKEDGSNKVSKVSEDLDYSTEDAAAWVNNGMAQLSSEFKKVTGDATEMVGHATKTLMKNVGNGLSQYNAVAAEVAKKLPGDVDTMAGKYPWVAMTFAFLAGFLLRGFLVPGRKDRK